jgi:hypothetical protein
MAGFFQELIHGAVAGFFGNDYLRDYTHASKTFTTNAFANSPKFKWLFHVYFDLNTPMTSNGYANQPNGEIPGLLVKNINLPKFSVALSEMNQYNHKRYVQTKINYDPIQIVFHDDNGGTIRNLWYQYYSYYYYDPNMPQSSSGIPLTDGPQKGAGAITNLNTNTTYAPDISNNATWGYRGDPAGTATSVAAGSTKPPFFKSIKIFGFNQHSFTVYNLVNPIIERFEHDTYDYYQSTGTMENRMTIKYESVIYEAGALNGRNPSNVATGFGDQAYYDTKPSPIMLPGANRNILGQGGLLSAGEGFVQSLANGNLLGAIQIAGRTKNTFQNPQNLFTTAKAELISGLYNATSPQNTRNVFNFPTTSGAYGVTAQQSTNNAVLPQTNNTIVNNQFQTSYAPPPVGTSS